MRKDADGSLIYRSKDNLTEGDEITKPEPTGDGTVTLDLSGNQVDVQIEGETSSAFILGPHRCPCSKHQAFNMSEVSLRRCLTTASGVGIDSTSYL